MSALLVSGLLALAIAQNNASPEFEAMRKRLAQDRVKMRYLMREENSILSGLVGLEKSIEEKQRQVLQLGQRLGKIEGRLIELDASIVANESVLMVMREQVGKRAAAMMRLRRSNLASIMARANEPGAVRRLADRLRSVLSYDTELMRGAKNASSKDRQLHAELTAEKSALAETKIALEAETSAALELKEDRAALLEAVKNERKNAERLATELGQAAKRLEQEIGVMHGLEPAPDQAPGGFRGQKGKLPWPAPGRVEITFGKKVDPGSGMVMVQKGIDLRAPVGTDVRAVFDGRVAYASWFDGFGRLLVIEHPDGFFSLYAHLESFALAKGARVNAQQVLGTIGDSGSTKGSYLYFEIRDGKEALDPLLWLVR